MRRMANFSLDEAQKRELDELFRKVHPTAKQGYSFGKEVGAQARFMTEEGHGLLQKIMALEVEQGEKEPSDEERAKKDLISTVTSHLSTVRTLGELTEYEQKYGLAPEKYTKHIPDVKEHGNALAQKLEEASEELRRIESNDNLKRGEKRSAQKKLLLEKFEKVEALAGNKELVGFVVSSIVERSTRTPGEWISHLEELAGAPIIRTHLAARRLVKRL